MTPAVDDPAPAFAAVADGMLDRRLALDPQVALRPEPFGALAYHYGNRRLVFLRHPDMLRVVRRLDGCVTVSDALRGLCHRRRAVAVVRRRAGVPRALGGAA